ncbi:MAG: complement resistance protein TraT [Rickettsiaceae bacterium]|nr:complement resistance protein TraT [Rickettsiaceae bacterium]
MKKSCSNMLIIACSSAIMLGGCSASKNLMEHSSLKTETKMSSTIFLDPVSAQQKTVLLQIRNTSDKSNFNPKNKIALKLTNSGYRITDDPNKAHYLLQANILKVGEGKPEDVSNALLGGYGAALEGGAVGALAGLYANNHISPLTGGLAGAAIGMVADSMIKNVTYSVITDIQISERTNAKVTEVSNSNLQQGTSGTKTVVSNETTNWKRYQTRVVSSANKVNLDFAVAESELSEGLAQSISGIFG